MARKKRTSVHGAVQVGNYREVFGKDSGQSDGLLSSDKIMQGVRDNRKVNDGFDSINDNSGLRAFEDCISGVYKYKAGLYARLSFESVANRERNTIENQMELLKDYVERCEDIEVVETYADISHTGTDFDRPEFMRMMQDVRFEKINCVIVKDLSRLGRNYLEAGNYIERVFPFFGVRFIAVNDNYDSNCKSASGEIIYSVSNIFNEYYARDISMKVKSAMRNRIANGEYVIPTVPYGYIKDPFNKKHLIPDKDVCENVKKIFEMYLESGSAKKIALAMTEAGALPPSVYRTWRNTGVVPENARKYWIAGTITVMLKNSCYVGDIVYARKEKKIFADKREVSNPKEEWIVVKDAHEPLVSREMFDMVQEKIKEGGSRICDWSLRMPNKENNPLLGHVFCADCGRPMNLKRPKSTAPNYTCSGYVKNGSCDASHYIKADELQNAVFQVIHTQIKVYKDKAALLERQLKKNRQEGISESYEKELKRIEGDIRKCISDRQVLYEDYVNGLIDREMYVRKLAVLKEEENVLRGKIESIQQSRKHNEYLMSESDSILKKIDEYSRKRKLVYDMVDAFVDKVLVHKDKLIDVRMSIQDISEMLDVKLRECGGENNV